MRSPPTTRGSAGNAPPRSLASPKSLMSPRVVAYNEQKRAFDFKQSASLTIPTTRGPAQEPTYTVRAAHQSIVICGLQISQDILSPSSEDEDDAKARGALPRSDGDAPQKKAFTLNKSHIAEAIPTRRDTITTPKTSPHVITTTHSLIKARDDDEEEEAPLLLLTVHFVHPEPPRRDRDDAAHSSITLGMNSSSQLPCEAVHNQPDRKPQQQQPLSPKEGVADDDVPSPRSLDEVGELRERIGKHLRFEGLRQLSRVRRGLPKRSQSDGSKCTDVRKASSNLPHADDDHGDDEEEEDADLRSAHDKADASAAGVKTCRRAKSSIV